MLAEWFRPANYSPRNFAEQGYQRSFCSCVELLRYPSRFKHRGGVDAFTAFKLLSRSTSHCRVTVIVFPSYSRWGTSPEEPNRWERFRRSDPPLRPGCPRCSVLIALLESDHNPWLVAGSRQRISKLL